MRIDPTGDKMNGKKSSPGQMALAFGLRLTLLKPDYPWTFKSFETI